MPSHLENSNSVSNPSSTYNTTGNGGINPSSLSFSHHPNFSLSSHFGANSGLNRLFNAALDHSQALLGFYSHKPNASIIQKSSPIEDENLSENGSVSSNHDQRSKACKRQPSYDQNEQTESNHEESSANLKSNDSTYSN